MELGAQIKKYRGGLGLSQEELAERIYVSRQSISNWETGRTYPDLKSLLMLGEVFGVSLDSLVKGDIETMKNEIDSQELAEFNRDSAMYTGLFAAMLLTPIPLCKWLGWYGAAVWLVIAAAGFYYAIRVERHKKKFDVHTYREILAFTEGKSLDEIEKAREEGKRGYQKVLLALGAALLGAVVTALMFWLLG